MRSLGVMFLLVLSFSVPATTHAKQNHRSRVVAPVVSEKPGGPKHVLIGFKRNPGADGKKLIEGLGGTVKYEYHLIPAIAAQVSDTAIATLRKNPSVTVVEPDLYAIKRESITPQSNWGTTAIGIPSIANKSINGSSVKVAIIDTGIDYTHPDLRSAYAGGYNFLNKSADPFDDNGHGTHVAGIIAGENGLGVAPGAQLYALKILDSTGTGYFSDIVAALEWSVDHHMQVTNNSYGTREDPGTLVAAAFANANKAGLLSVAAAGNSGSCSETKSTTEFPGRYDSVLSVASINENNQHSCFSSLGQEVNISAPGEHILSTKRGGGYISLSGTSMAVPFVVGTAALVISSGVTDTNGNGSIADEVQQILQATSIDLGAPGQDEQFGAGLVNAAAAVDRAIGSSTKL